MTNNISQTANHSSEHLHGVVRQASSPGQGGTSSAGIHSLHNVGKFSVYITGSAHTLQGSASLLNPTTVHKTVGGVRNDQAAQEEDEGWHNTDRRQPWGCMFWVP